MITVIGATNIDIIASTKTFFVPHDSNPSHIVMGIGGVGKNYAHNLSLLGQHIQFVTLFGDDQFGDIAKKECKRLGFDLHLSATPKGARSSMFLCVNNNEGHMEAGAADVTLMEEWLTPEFLEKRMDEINQSQLVLFDANLPVPSMVYLLDHCTVPMMADTVSRLKAIRIGQALEQAEHPRLHTLKLNHIEAEYIFGIKMGQDLTKINRRLHQLGVDYVYITDGSKGVHCSAPKSCQPNELDLAPIAPTCIVDTNGAGDAFISGLAFAFLQDIPFPEAADYGLWASKATIEVESVVNPNLLHELNTLLKKHINYQLQ